MTEPRLICRICGVEVTLSSEPTVRMAEVATFYAAHNSHDEGLGVEVTFDTPKQDEELG